MSDDDVEILYLEKGSKTLHKPAHESMGNLETTPLAALKGTPNQISCYRSKFDGYNIVFCG